MNTSVHQPPNTSLEQARLRLTRWMGTGSEYEYFIQEEDAPCATFSVLLPLVSTKKSWSSEVFEELALGMIGRLFDEIDASRDLDIGVDARWLQPMLHDAQVFVRVCGTMRRRGCGVGA